MYRPALFAEDRLEILHDLIRTHRLATLVTTGAEGLMANLLPFSLIENGGKGILHAHLAKENTQISSLRAGEPALVIFHGAESYISPSWYPSKQEHEKVVPTWNYAVVQVRGIPRVIDDLDWLKNHVEELTAEMEKNRPDPWKVSDAPQDFMTAMLNGIVGLEIPIDDIKGKWKVSQNRSKTDRQGVIEGLHREGLSQEMSQYVNNGGALKLSQK